MSDKLNITLIKSIIGVPVNQRKVVAGLGLRKLMQKVVLADTPETRGMINKVPHMLKVEC